MNKKQIRLTESDLKRIVKESVNKILNEAYGTMNAQDSADISHIESDTPPPPYLEPHTNSKKYNSGKNPSSAYKSLNDFFECLSRCEDIAGSNFYDFNEAYTEAIFKHLNKAEVLAHKIAKIAKMNLGQQPNPFYDKDKTYLRNAGFAGAKYTSTVRPEASKDI